jgi:hypothetical protein
MGNKLKAAAAIISMSILCSWTLTSETTIKKAGWLIGTWENKTSRGSVYETWKKVSENEFLGKTYMLKDKDTVLFETVRLKQEKDNLYYIPTVEDQNQGKPVSFALKFISDEEMVFENLQHDFPQLISYKKTGVDALVAEISNVGRTKKQSFPMKKIK